MIYQVAIKKSKDGYNLISLDRFIEMELAERTELILSGKVSFLDEEGGLIDLIDAVKSLKEK